MATRTKKLTKAELLEKLRYLATQNDGDVESNHGNADDLLLRFIHDPEIEAAYDAITKWYA